MSEANRIGALAGLDSSLTTSPTQAKQQSTGEVTKNEFMTLLVAQLQNQDPLNPMQNEEFAVQLAQFTQLEELIKIREASESESSNFTSLATYLGHDITLNSSAVEVSNGEAGQISFDLEQDATNVVAEFLNQDGNVVDSVELGPFSKGNHKHELSGLSIPGGSYEVRLQAQSAYAGPFQPEVYASGTVSGFVPGDEPILLVGDREVSPSEIKDVRLGGSATE